MAERKVDIVVSEEIRTRLKALKGTDTYDSYLDRLMRSGSSKN